MSSILQPASPANGASGENHGRITVRGALLRVAQFLMPGMEWSLLAIVFLATLYCIFSRVLLPYVFPVSHQGWTQCELVEVRTPISTTSIEIRAPLNSRVQPGQEICVAANELVDRTEERTLTQEVLGLQARLAGLTAERGVVCRRLDEVSAALKIFLAQSVCVCKARRDSVEAQIDAARANLEVADAMLSRLKNLGSNATEAEREKALAEHTVAASAIVSLEAELLQLQAEAEALRQGISLSHVDLIDRKSLLALRVDELEVAEQRARAELEGAEQRQRDSQSAVEARSHASMVSPVFGRIAWVAASSGTIDANEPLIRIARPVEHVEAHFEKDVANRIFPGQRAVISLATGLHMTGHVVTIDESSPQAERQSRLIDIVCRPEQVRVILSLEPVPETLDLAGGIPAHVALAGHRKLGFLMSASLFRWCLLAGLFAAGLWLVSRAVRVQLNAKGG